MKTELLPPQDLDAERSVLGSMMVAADYAVDLAIQIVEPGHFYTEAHQKVFACVRDMHNGGEKIDAVTLGHALAARGCLESIGGPAYVVQLLEAVPHAAHVEYYARIVREKADRRSVIEHATAMLRAAYDDTADMDDSMQSVESEMTKLSEARARGNASVDLMTVLVESIASLEAGTVRGMMTGFPELDAITTGIHNGQLIVIAARPSIGKSSFAGCLAYHMSVSIPTLYFSLEMSRLELADRLLSIESAVSFYDMRNGRLDEQQHYYLNEGRNGLASRQLIIDDESERSVTSLASVARSMKRKHGTGLIIVDYLQLLQPAEKKTPREQQVAEMTRALKCLAKSLNIPVVVLAQLNREIESRSKGDQKPKLSDLRESGAIEQDADQVWMLHRPCFYLEATDPSYDESESSVYVRKNRSGPTGRVDLEFRKDTMQFKSKVVEYATDFN